MNGNVWVVENWTDETLHFEDPDENTVSLRISFAFFNCNNCKIKIVGKCQNVKLNSCKKTEIITDMIVSQVEVYKCEAIEVRGIKQLPMVLVENSKQTHIWLYNSTKACKVSTSSTRSTFIHFAKDGVTDDQLEELSNWTKEIVPEVYTSQLVGGKLITEWYLEEE